MKTSTSENTDHQFWATISGREKDDIQQQLDAVVRWGVNSVEFRLDLIPSELWPFIFNLRGLSVPWWIAHFGTGADAGTVAIVIRETIKSQAHGAIFHSRCECLSELIGMCKKAGRPFAAPYHSQEPLSRDDAVEEFRFQETLRPTFRKIAVRARTYSEAAALIDATYSVYQNGGTPVVGAVFGPQRWARIALPHAGSAITFIVAHPVQNEVGGDDQQLHLKDIEHLSAVRGLLVSGLNTMDASALALSA